MIDISKIEQHHLTALKNMMPYGYGKALREIVKKTNGKKYTEHSIHRGLTKNYLSKRIFDAAIEYAREFGDVDRMLRDASNSIKDW